VGSKNTQSSVKASSNSAGAMSVSSALRRVDMGRAWHATFEAAVVRCSAWGATKAVVAALRKRAELIMIKVECCLNFCLCTHCVVALLSV